MVEVGVLTETFIFSVKVVLLLSRSKILTNLIQSELLLFLCSVNKEAFLLHILEPGHHLTLDLFDVVLVLQVEVFNFRVGKA